MLNKTSTMPSIETKKRIIWLDYAKFFCIMFVIISHLEANTDIFFAFYQPFFLFGFFFVSGYVYNKSTSFKNLIIKKKGINATNRAGKNQIWSPRPRICAKFQASSSTKDLCSLNESI